MFLKFALVIVSLGACACTLLALRQSRLQAAHELAEAQLRIRHHDERLWRLKSEIASRVAPEHVQLMAADLGPMHPLLPPPPTLAIPGLDLAGTGTTALKTEEGHVLGVEDPSHAPVKPDRAKDGAATPARTPGTTPNASPPKSKNGSTPAGSPSGSNSDAAPKATPKPGKAKTDEPARPTTRRPRLADGGKPGE